MGDFIHSTKGKITLCCIAVLVLSVMVCTMLFLIFNKDKELGRSIKVTEAVGTVLVSNERGSNVHAYVGMELTDGDRINVTEGARLMFELDSSKYTVAEENTELTLALSINEGSEQTLITLEKGSILTFIKEPFKDGESYNITTPNSIISACAAVYAVSVSEGAMGDVLTSCICFGGEVEMLPINGEGEPTEDSQYASAGMSAGIMTNFEDNSSSSSSFVLDNNGCIQSPIDYSELSHGYIEALIDFTEGGEELCISEDELLGYLIHEHIYSSEWSYDGQKHWHEAICEHQELDGELPRNEQEHLFSETGTEEVLPSGDSVITYICSICGYSKQEEPPHTHTYGDYIKGSSGHYRICTDCGEKTDEEPHCGGAPTCIKKAECTVCGNEYGEQSSSHVFEEAEWEVGESGHFKRCITCATPSEEEEHDFGSPNASKDNSAYHQRSCADCGYTEKEKHSFQPFKAVENNSAYHSRVCEDCGYTEKKNHSYGAWECSKDNSEYHYRICDKCEHIEKEKHSFGKWKEDVDNGERHICSCKCGIIKSEEHSFGESTSGISPSDNRPANIFTCADCSFKKYEIIYNDNALFGAGGSRFGEGELLGALKELSKSESDGIIYLLRDDIEVGFSKGFSLPLLSSGESEINCDIYEMTWDLNGHHLAAEFTPLIGESATWTIIATNGGMLSTGGSGFDFSQDTALCGNIVIKGGLFDFDPAEYVPEGFASKKLGDFKLWIVCTSGTEQSDCKHGGFSYIDNSTNSEAFGFCGICGAIKTDHIHNGSEADRSCRQRPVCGICGKEYGSYGSHILDPEYKTDSALHWQSCTLCDFHTEKEAHSGGEATYTAQAVCDICKRPYGNTKDIDKAPLPKSDILEICMGEVPKTLPYKDKVAASIGFLPIGYSDGKMEISFSLDGVPNESTEKYGLKYEPKALSSVNAHGYLFIRSKLYANEGGAYPISFRVNEGYSILLVYKDGSFKKHDSQKTSSIDSSVKYIIAAKEAFTEEVQGQSSLNICELVGKCFADDPYGCIVLETVFDPTDFVLELMGIKRNIIQEGGVREAIFNPESGIFETKSIGLAISNQLGGSGYSLGSISSETEVSFSCTDGHTEHENISGSLIINEYLNSDGSSTLKILESAFELPSTAESDGSYTHFAECWYYCGATRRIFFYFSVGGTKYSYYALLQTPEGDKSGEALNCYDSITSSDFGWTEDAILLYNEYFVSGTHTDIKELYTLY